MWQGLVLSKTDHVPCPGVAYILGRDGLAAACWEVGSGVQVV